jgi:ribosome-binding protein aMBF1 (putative translation factor)
LNEEQAEPADRERGGTAGLLAGSAGTGDLMTTTTKTKQGELDEQIGRRIRDRRTLSGLAQHELAKALGISHQQLQKYEAGKNRISASRLWRCAEILHTPISDFFSDRPENTVANGSIARDRVRIRLRA